MKEKQTETERDLELVLHIENSKSKYAISKFRSGLYCARHYSIVYEVRGLNNPWSPEEEQIWGIDCCLGCPLVIASYEELEKYEKFYQSDEKEFETGGKLADGGSNQPLTIRVRRLIDDEENFRQKTKTHFQQSRLRDLWDINNKPINQLKKE